MKLDRTTLDEFIVESDRLGVGSEQCNALWKDVLYAPQVTTDAQLNPTSTAYLKQQLALYEELTGHEYSDARDEATGDIPVAELLNAPNAYNQPNPAEYAKHCVAMGMLVKDLQLPRGARILELGSGWGFTQEFLASCGYETIGVEINKNFVDISNARLMRLGFGPRVVNGSFESFDPASVGHIDAVISYEAFHHAVDPKAMLKKYSEPLKEGGIFALMAEPFNNYYKTWGLRLDPYSIYSIRKYGWFESGWSVEYMAYLYSICGLEAQFTDSGINELTRYMIGRKSGRLRPYQLGMWHPDVVAGWWAGWDFCCSKGKSKLLLVPPRGANKLILEVVNFNVRALKVSLSVAGHKRKFTVMPGESKIEFDVGAAPQMVGEDLELQVHSDTYCPRTLGLNDDSRILGIHISYVNWG